MKFWLLILAGIAFAMMVLSLLVWAAAYLAAFAVVAGIGVLVWKAYRQ